MPLKIFDTSDAIPEALRESAIETKDGKFAVAEDEDTSGLKSALEKERKGRRDAEARAKAEADEKAALKAEKEAADLDKAGLKEVKAKWQKDELEPVAKERDAFKAKFHARAHAGELKGILAELDVIDVAAGYKLFGDEFALDDEDKLVLKADPTADVKAHLEKVLTEKYAFMLKGSQAAGGGSRGSKGAGAGGTGENVFQWTEAQRADFIQKHGYDAYKAKLDASVATLATANTASKQTAA